MKGFGGLIEKPMRIRNGEQSHDEIVVSAIKEGGVDGLMAQFPALAKDPTFRLALTEGANRLTQAIRGFDETNPLVVFSQFEENELRVLLTQICNGEIGQYVNLKALAGKNPNEVASAIKASSFLPTRRPPRPGLVKELTAPQEETSGRVGEVLAEVEPEAKFKVTKPRRETPATGITRVARPLITYGSYESFSIDR